MSKNNAKKLSLKFAPFLFIAVTVLNAFVDIAVPALVPSTYSESVPLLAVAPWM